MSLKLQLGVNFNVCVLSNWRDTNVKLDMEAKPPHETYTHGGELHSHAWHHFLPILLVVSLSLTVFLI